MGQGTAALWPWPLVVVRRGPPNSRNGSHCDSDAHAIVVSAVKKKEKNCRPRKYACSVGMGPMNPVEALHCLMFVTFQNFITVWGTRQVRAFVFFVPIFNSSETVVGPLLDSLPWRRKADTTSHPLHCLLVHGETCP